MTELVTTPDRLVLDLPGLRLVNPLNAREHWATRAKRARAHRDAVANAVLALRHRDRLVLAVPPARPKVIRFEVTQPRRFDDDAIPGAVKALRDGLQDCGVIDHDGPTSGHRFCYEPAAKGPPRVRITVTRRGPAED
jgi:hypothetical protein